MNKIQKTLIGTVLGGALLTLTPLAMADRYVNNHYYGGHAPAYQQQHPVHQRHPRYKQRQREVVHHHYYHAPPVRERVVVVQPPRHHYDHAPQYQYDRGPSYDRDPSYGHVASGHYQSHTPMILGGIIGGG
ncbi:MAG: hypothetical protein LC646_08695, partial [Xanthomonadaceae bacterium]|nr:hypothetical protein [Xanthomonadaceae bacterium]